MTVLNKAIAVLCISALILHKQCTSEETLSRTLAGIYSSMAIETPELPDLQTIIEILQDALPDKEVVPPDLDYGPFELGAVVDTVSGPVQGAKISHGHAFYSIPFAQPPLGELRFQPPQPIVEPLELINATEPTGVTCFQRKRNCTNGFCIYNVNEDCLVLNIHVPRSVDFEKIEDFSYPVLVWFHGGGFLSGGATIPEFEGRYLSNATQSVVVTVNYRLSVFGFLVHGEGDTAFNGNQGMKDQQLALQWVQDNIHKFGGDKDMVTIFGNSAGAQSVMLHLVSDVSKPLFHRGIMQSNPAVFPYQTREEAIVVTNRILRRLNCSKKSLAAERECLMSASAEELTKQEFPVMAMSLVEDHDVYSTVEAFRPTLDGSEFKVQPFTMFRDGTWHTEKDVIFGTNRNELELIQYYIPENIRLTKKRFEKLINIVLGEDLGPIVTDYYEAMVPDGTKDYKLLLGHLSGHMFFHCPSRLMARLASKTSNGGRIYMYSNAHTMEDESCKDQMSAEGLCDISFHGSEPPFVFRSGPSYGLGFTENDTMVSNEFDSYWVNFARSGNPSNGELPDLGEFTAWPEYKLNDVGMTPRRAKRTIRPNMVTRNRANVPSWSNIRIQAPNSEVENEYLEEICDFWDSLNYYLDLSSTEVSTATAGTDKTTTSAFVSTVGRIESTTSAAQTTCSSSILLFIIAITLTLC